MSATLIAEPPAVPRDDLLYEVVDGRTVELKPMAAKESGLANSLGESITEQMPRPKPGQVFIEMLFGLDKKKGKRDRRPDLAYVSFDRWPSRQFPDDDAWPMIPGLAAEIVSKSNSAREVRGKIEDYFKAGVGLVWVIYPERHLIDVHSGPNSIQTLRADDTLNGGDVMPWFKLPLAQLFANYPILDEDG